MGKTIAQIAAELRPWSEKTFGPGKRTIGVLKHIVKEVEEIADDPTDTEEWIDVILLAIDGAWRHGASPEKIEKTLLDKMEVIQKRKYPKQVPDDVPMEHVREGAEAVRKIMYRVTSVIEYEAKDMASAQLSFHRAIPGKRLIRAEIKEVARAKKKSEKI